MSKITVVAGSNRTEARNIITGALRGYETPVHERSDAPYNTPGAIWEPDETSESAKRAVVMETIGQTPDPTSGPDEYVYGRIRVLGKDYTPGNEEDEPEYDECACLELVGLAEDEHKERLLRGTQVAVAGPFTRENPDHDPESGP